jgi:multiple antibiotic resistance protein
MNAFIQLIVLFFVIFDPFLSGMVFLSATKNMNNRDRIKVGIYATAVAMFVSALFLFFGNSFLSLFSTNLNDIRVAGGILLGILGVEMSLGLSVGKDDSKSGDSSKMAIASLIGTPLLTGPAAITTIIITTNDYGMLNTGLAVFLVLLFAGLLFVTLSKLKNKINPTPIRVLSTILGLITLAWGINFIRIGLGF